MENNLVNWQSIWHSQKSKPMQFTDVINRLNTIEQKAKTQRIILLLGLAILIVSSIVWFSDILNEKYNQMAYVLIVLAIGVKLVPSLLGRYNIIANEANFNNRMYIEKLKEKMKFDTNQLLIFLLLAIISLNFSLLGLAEKGTIFNFELMPRGWVLLHLSTIGLFIFAYFLKKKKLLRSQHEISTLINELEALS